MSVKKHVSLCLEIGWSHDHKLFLFDLLVYLLKEEKNAGDLYPLYPLVALQEKERQWKEILVSLLKMT